MSALAVRRATRGLRRHTSGVVVVLALGGLIAVHHSAIASGEMQHGAMGTAIELCLGILTVAGAAVAAIGLPFAFSERWHRGAGALPLGIRLAPRQFTREARAGPPLHPRLCVWRR